MNLGAVSSTNFTGRVNNDRLTKGQKRAAFIAGGIVTAGAIATTVAAVKGKKAGQEKLFGAIKEGYKMMGTAIADKAKSIKNAIFKPKADKAAKVAAEA